LRWIFFFFEKNWELRLYIIKEYLIFDNHGYQIWYTDWYPVRVWCNF
jgi:hypothetical protein